MIIWVLSIVISFAISVQKLERHAHFGTFTVTVKIGILVVNAQEGKFKPY